MRDVSVSEFSLEAGFVRQFHLHKSIDDAILLVIVGAKPIRLKMATTNAEGQLLEDA